MDNSTWKRRLIIAPKLVWRDCCVIDVTPSRSLGSVLVLTPPRSTLLPASNAARREMALECRYSLALLLLEEAQ